MAKRITRQVSRSTPLSVFLNDTEIQAYEGETLATLILLSDDPICKLDKAGNPRGPFCNMGVCYDCLVTVIEPDGPNKPLNIRACMTIVKPGIQIYTRLHKGGTL